jgi:hypothetical protein
MHGEVPGAIIARDLLDGISSEGGKGAGGWRVEEA